MSREVAKEVFVDAPVEAVWRALTEADELIRWFPLDARVTPGVGGSIWISWGEGAAGEAPITAWEPHKRLQWTESRGAVKIAIDFHLETRDGGTVVRLVQSGFGDGPEWDGEFHMVDGGWTYFLTHLQWYFTHHNGTPRSVIGLREQSSLPGDDVFMRLKGLMAQVPATLLFDRSHSRQAAYTIPSMNNAILFIEIEPGADTVRGGFWLSTYGLGPSQVESMRLHLMPAYREALGLTPQGA